MLVLYSSVVLGLIASVSAQTFAAGVQATGTQGITNPPAPTTGTSINQTSMARMLSVNSIEDFCIFAPPTEGDIADSETIEVAWCTQARNNARVIPDGVLTGVSFLKTDFYVQIIGYGDFTKLNIPAGDEGGELDPHGAFGSGNPIGGNVTTNITGSDLDVAEWMLYIDYNQFCLRACTNANSTYDAEHMCWHELDEMGCEFVMPGNYNVNGTFESCDADVAYPPGWYPVATNGESTSFSTFAQYFTGVLSNGVSYTVGDTVTPSAPYFTPSSSNCVTTGTVSNGIALASLGVSGAATATGSSGTAAATGSSGSSSRSTSGTATATSGSASSSESSSSNAAAKLSPANVYHEGMTLVALISGIAAIALFH